MTAISREDPVFFVDLYDEDTEGARPDRLFEVRPQESVQRRTVEQIVDNTLIVPSLDVLVPQMENQLVEVCRQLDVRIHVQAIEVPKISSSSRHCRRCVRFAEQTAEKLVEVPTIISYSSLLQRTVEQHVDIPVLGRGGRNVSRQRFPPRQQRSLLLRNAVLSGLWNRSLLGFFFGLFPKSKKSPKISPHSGSELSADFNPSTLSAHQMAPNSLLWSQDECTEMVDDNGHAWVRLDTARGSF